MTLDSEAVAVYVRAAHDAGCPPDQIERFLRAGVILHPKQLQASAAARLCDYRCPRCEDLFKRHQKPFKDCPDCGPTSVGYSGSRSGGKTYWMVAQTGCDDCQRFPGLKCLMLRKIGKTNTENFSDFAAKLFRNLPHKPTDRGNVVEFQNGSRIILGHYNDERDIDQYLGVEYDEIDIEETNTISSGKKINVISSLRTAKDGWRPRHYETWNPGGVDHCVPYGEVLTPSGWRDIRDFASGDPIYTVRHDGVMVESVVQATVSVAYAGEMIKVNARGLRMTCTPNHNVAKVGGRRAGLNTKIGAKDRFSLVPFTDLPGQATILRTVGWEGKPLESFTVPDYSQPIRKRKYEQPRTLTGIRFAKLLGWFLSEGCAHKPQKACGKAISIAQMKPHGRVKIKELLDECGFVSHWYEKSVVIYSAEWWEYFWQFGKCRDKFVPGWFKQCDQETLRAFFNAYCDGDGCWSKWGESGNVATISRQLADDVQEIALKLGFVVSLNTVYQEDRDGPKFVINFKRVKSGGTEILTGNHVYEVPTETVRRSDITREHFEGEVYCVTVPRTHSFVIRQDSSIWVSGNSNLKKKYVIPHRRGEERSTRYIHATVYDNPSVNPEYITDVLEKLDGWKRRAWLYGDQDIEQGAFFPTFNYETHVLKRETFDLPTHWEIWGGLDYGLTHYTVFYLMARDDDGNLYVLDEHAMRGWIPEQHAAAIRALLARWEKTPADLTAILAGHDCFQRRQFQDQIGTLEMEYARHGLQLTKANIDRVSGAAELARRLGVPGPNPADPPLVRPTIHFLDSCPRLIECIPSLQHSKTNPEDVQKVDCDENGEGGDDFYDACRHCYMKYASAPSYASAPPVAGPARDFATYVPR